MKEADVLIIGAGAAGLSASIYLARSRVKTIIVDKGAPGGTLLNVHKIENYPGVASLSGLDLAMNFLNQATGFGVEVEYDSIAKIEKEGEEFHVYGDEEYFCSALIVATGMKIGAQPVKGEKEYLGKGVSYCATCDGAFYRGKEVAIIGYSDRLAEEAIYLAGIVAKVHVLLAKEPAWSEEHASVLQGFSSVVFYPNAKLESVNGEKTVESISFLQNGESKSLSVSGVFPLDQEGTSTDFLYALNPAMQKGFLAVDESMATSVPGLFACGDVVAKKLRQVVTAASDGALAATSAISYVRALANKKK